MLHKQEMAPDSEHMTSEIIKLKRERFRCNIRQERTKEIFKKNRSMMLSQSKVEISQEVLDIIPSTQQIGELSRFLFELPQRIDQGHYQYVLEGLVRLRVAQQQSPHQCTEMFLREGLIFQIARCMNPQRSQERQLQFEACYLCFQIDDSLADGELNHLTYCEHVLLCQDELIQGIEAIISDESNLEAREQGLFLLGSSIHNIKGFGDNYFNMRSYQFLLKVLMKETQLFIEVLWVLGSLIGYFGAFDEELKPLFRVLDRLFCHDDMNVVVQVTKVLTGILQIHDDPRKIAWKIIEMSNFQIVLGHIEYKTAGPEIMLFISSCVGCIQDYYHIIQNRSDLPSFRQWLDLSDRFISSGNNNLRRNIYWTLSNLIVHPDIAREVMEHPNLIDKVLCAASFESINCKNEIVHLFKALLYYVLLNKGLLPILSDFMDFQQMQIHLNVQETILLLIGFAKQAWEQPDSQDDFILQLRGLKNLMISHNLDKKLENRELVPDEKATQFEYFFMNY